MNFLIIPCRLFHGAARVPICEDETDRFLATLFDYAVINLTAVYV